MSEEEINNKIRLNQARRAAVQERVDKADGITPNMNVDQRLKRKEKLYGKYGEKSNTKDYAKNFTKIASPVAVMKKGVDMVTAPMQFRVMDVPIYGMALALAGFKDLLDLAIGIIPGVVTVIGWCISMAIGFILLFDGVGGAQRKVARNLTKKMLVLLAGTIVESLFFGLNYLPFEMFTVAIIYWMSLLERKRAQRIEEGN
ncbi:MAG: hypothetical protein WAV16_01915 [Candidatus Moraniibacteriota bacterium]